LTLAELMLGLLQPAMMQAPTAFAQWLCALDFALSRPREIAIVGNIQSADTQALLNIVYDGYRPNQIVAVASPDRASSIPLLADRSTIGRQATAYVCQHFTCQQPVTEPAALRQQLA